MKHLKKFKSWGEWMEDRRNVQYSPTIAYIEKEDEIIISEGKTGREAYYGAMPDNMLAINDKSNLEWLMIDGESIDLSEPIVEKTREYTTNWQIVEDPSEFTELNKEYLLQKDWTKLELISSELDIDWEKIAPYFMNGDVPETENEMKMYSVATSFIWINTDYGSAPLVPMYGVSEGLYKAAVKLELVDPEILITTELQRKLYGINWIGNRLTISKSFSYLTKSIMGYDVKSIFIGSEDATVINTNNIETYREGAQIYFNSEGNHIVNFEFKDPTTIENTFTNTCVVSFNDSALEKVERINMWELSCPYLQAITFGESLRYVDLACVCAANLTYIKFLGKCPDFQLIEDGPDIFMVNKGTLEFPKNHDYSNLIENTELKSWVHKYVHGHMMRYISESELGRQQVFHSEPYKMFVNEEEIVPSSYYEFTEPGCYKIDFVLNAPYNINIPGQGWYIWLDDKFFGEIHVNNNTFLYKTTEFDFYFKRFSGGQAKAYDVKLTVPNILSNSSLSVFGPNFDKSQVNYVITNYSYTDGVLTNQGDTYYNNHDVFIRFNTLTNCESMFEGNMGRFIDVEGLDTRLVTSMKNMFNGSRFIELNLQNFDTSNVTDMSGMFAYSQYAQKIDVSSFDTSNVTSMSYMFAVIPCLELDVSNFDTSKVTDMSYMFFMDTYLEKIDVSNFDTSNVTNMEYMFSFNFRLNYLDLSKWDTSNVRNMRTLFAFCDNLKTIDLSSFSFKNCTDTREMFTIKKNWEDAVNYNVVADKLKTVIINWDKEGELPDEMKTMFESDFKDVLLIYNGKHYVSNLLEIVPYTWTAIPQLW